MWRGRKHMRDLFDKIKFSTTAASRQPSQPSWTSVRMSGQTIPNEIAIRTRSPHINSQIRKLNVLMSCALYVHVAACHQFFFFSFFLFRQHIPFVTKKVRRYFCRRSYSVYLLCHWKWYNITGSRTTKTHRNQRFCGETTPRAPLSTVHALRESQFLVQFLRLRAIVNVWTKWHIYIYIYRHTRFITRKYSHMPSKRWWLKK